MIKLLIMLLIVLAVPVMVDLALRIRPLWRWVEKQNWWKEICR